MSFVNFVLVGVALLMAASPVLAECERNEYGVFESEVCAVAALSEADNQLNSTYHALLSSAHEEAKEKLASAQRAWLAYRSANAEFVYAMEGGSLGRTIVANDSERQAVARNKELSSWLPRN